jgi:benzodiazapine receptor
MVFNGASSALMPYSLSEITDQWDTRIDPATWAFAIWGVIYSLLGSFVFYQALPGSMVPERNDQLIFGDIGYHFFTNMMINSIWLVLFQTNTTWGFTVGLIDIIAMLTSNIFMMVQALNSSVNATEFISMRGGLSIYSGWVTAATILNASYMFKAYGVADPNIPYFDEE